MEALVVAAISLPMLLLIVLAIVVARSEGRPG
jgi:hypothetical protein